MTEKAVKIVKYFEGLYLKPYICPAGYKTVGYGHLTNSDEKITVEEAERLLVEDLYKTQKAVLRLITVPLEEHELDALISFTFNVGAGALQRSTLRMKINRNEKLDAAEEFMKWCRAGGKILKGLVKRRYVEKVLFTTGELII